ncbi:unnamed protein product [Acanthoscelides obtectus]|uniref:DUF4780 domain-containing protein n=1 Tax=Acanthoscelides obtectus TaxID=200917 RepID=A0A9P0JV94_ACAOB|nr:unnamed protein product [Acanthoscelides obtectus]CAK1653021.1 hypothetical protein AOBTE_LOCUS18016 [Acanthoscelides obtectus]
MDKQFSNKQTGHWGGSNTSNYSTGWPLATANIAQGYGSTSKMTPEQWAVASTCYAAQKQAAIETYSKYDDASTPGPDDRQKQNSSKLSGAFNTNMQNMSQRKPPEGYGTGRTSYGGTKLNTTAFSEQRKGYGDSGRQYGAGSSNKFPESSAVGTKSMSYGSSMPARELDRTNVPYGTSKFASEGTMSYADPMQSSSMSYGGTQGRHQFYQTPANTEGLASKRQETMSAGRYGRQQDRFSGTEEDTVPRWKRQSTEDDNLPAWKKRAMEEGRLAPSNRQRVEEDSKALPVRGMGKETPSSWKKNVTEEENLPAWKRRALQEGRMQPPKRVAMEEDETPSWKKRRTEDDRILPSQMRGMQVGLSPREKRAMEKERLPSSQLRRTEEETVPQWKKKQLVDEDPLSSWKRRGIEEGRILPAKQRGMEDAQRNASHLSGQHGKGIDQSAKREQTQGLSKTQQRKMQKLEKARKKREKRARARKQAIEGGGKTNKEESDFDSEEEETPKPVIPEGIAMMVCDKRYPAVGLKESQTKIIMACLLKAMENLGPDESPQFNEHRFMMCGMLSIICANKSTCTWLTNTIEALREPWQGADLTVRRFQAPMTIYIPGAEGSTSEVETSLQDVNPYFKVQSWQFVNKQAGQLNVEYTYLIDCDTFEALKVIQFRPYYKNTRVLAKMVHRVLRETTEEPSEKETDSGNVSQNKSRERAELDILLEKARRQNEIQNKINDSKGLSGEAEIL